MREGCDHKSLANRLHVFVFLSSENKNQQPHISEHDICISAPKPDSKIPNSIISNQQPSIQVNFGYCNHAPLYSFFFSLCVLRNENRMGQ